MAIIGIDLGTSNSAAAVLRRGRPVIYSQQPDAGIYAEQNVPPGTSASSQPGPRARVVDAEFHETK